MKHVQTAMLIAAFIMTVVFFQNCSSDGFQALSSTDLSSTGEGGGGSGGGGGELTPPGPLGPALVGRSRGEVVTDCMSEAKYNSCIFYKNPVGGKNNVVLGGVDDDTQLESLGYQTFAVDILGTDDSGFLQNSKFEIDPTLVLLSGESQPSGLVRVKEDSQTKWKFRYEGAVGTGDPAHKVSQLMAYYWLNEFDKVLADQTGVSLTQGRKFYVDTHVRTNSSSSKNNAFFTTGTDDDGSTVGVIALGYADGAQFNKGDYVHDMALSAEVYAHEVCHGYMAFSTNNGHRPPSGQADPNLARANYCKTQSGCVGAINEGQADFCIAILYPDNNELGETWVNTVGGLSSRSMTGNESKSAQTMFSSTSGEIHGMGALYGSMWLKVWKEAKKSSNEVDIEKIFAKHVARLTYQDHFVTALGVIKSISQSDYPGKGYENLFQTEWDRRGL